MHRCNMNIFNILVLIVFLAVSGCGGEPGDATSRDASQPPAEPGGTITIGGESWAIDPSVQCSVFPGPIVNIAGYAAEDDAIEIVIDYGGPTGVRVGGNGPVSWHAVRNTIDIEIDGAYVRGTATFTEFASGTGESAEGSFEVTC